MAKCKSSRFSSYLKNSSKNSSDDFNDDDHLDMEGIENMRNMCNRIDSFLYYTPIYMLIIFYFLYCTGN